MNFFDQQIARLDKLQRKYKAIGFAYAVIKKYGEDRAGHSSALITYYGFLSLFPLLLVLTSILQIIVGSDPSLHAKLLNSIDHYFPILGQDLKNNIHGLSRNGLGLAAGLLFTFYGARGIADMLRFSFNNAWRVPAKKRPGFPNNAINSFEIIFAGGLGVLLATALSSYSSALGHSFIVRAFSLLLSFIILLAILFVVFRLGISNKQVPRRPIIKSAIIAAIAIQILQGLGGYIITHELKHLSTLYGTFAIVLGLLFWIYLMAQVINYSMEIGVVGYHKLWPRSLNDKKPTVADEKLKSLPPSL